MSNWISPPLSFLRQLPHLDQQLADSLSQLDEELKVLVDANEPSLLGANQCERLVEVAARHFTDSDGARRPLLHEDEVRLLSIPGGSLDEAERREIESHVVHTFNFLQQIPWTRDLRGIPEIARGHHEKLNGHGYPFKLSAPGIPLPTRMMTISDIFDALGAADRPYKRAVGLERSLEILEKMVLDGEIDADLFQLFVDAKVYERWRTEPFPY
jgi:hypothetical protein